tara:strand:- start:339 stop:659 length:321 start_codon:yes stop_codon:yes gene_type:complete
MNIRKGDNVEIVSGNDAGIRGEVLQLVPDKHGVVVEGANIRKKHQKQQETGGQRPLSAGMIEFEAPMHVSNVMLVCPKCDMSVRTSMKREKGKKTRICKKCGASFE